MHTLDIDTMTCKICGIDMKAFDKGEVPLCQTPEDKARQEKMRQDMVQRLREMANPAIVHVLQYFKFEHLPSKLQAVSKPFATLAEEIADRAPRNPETTIALRKLLEAKDAAVRAAL
jgi:hypothetical protein